MKVEKEKMEKKKEGRKENSVIINLVPFSRMWEAPSESLQDFIILVKNWIYPGCSLDFMDRLFINEFPYYVLYCLGSLKSTFYHISQTWSGCYNSIKILIK